LLTHAQTLSEPLYQILAAAETIRRVVWNGQVMTAGSRGHLTKLKTILNQISETGERSNALFAASIGDLYETVLTSSLQNSEFVSHLLIDLLDRNLYERADDCRWWALTPELRVAFAGGEWDNSRTQHIASVLQYINSLYTVYTRIFVYDTRGGIVASSQLDAMATGIDGMFVGRETVDRVLRLSTEQDYCVTPFAPSPLYGDEPTYVYHAAIRDPHNDQQVVGGIGIVFNSGPEFSAMLRGGLGSQARMKALFVDRKGTVIASTDPKRPVGTVLEVSPATLAIPNGTSTSSIVVHDGQYTVMGCTASCGYREFKVSDGYSDDVLAVVFEPLGEVRGKSHFATHGDTVIKANTAGPAGEEFATFFVDGGLFAIPSESVQEAVSATKIASAPVGERQGCIGLLALEQDDEDFATVWVFDLGRLIRGTTNAGPRNGGLVIILRSGDERVGLLVDELHGVPEFRADQIFKSPFGMGSASAPVKRLIKANDGNLLIQVLDVDALLEAATRRSKELVLDL
jgi:chemotaxis signal transduction protein